MGSPTASKPKSVREKYDFARGPQLVNRVVDIGAHLERKVDANLVNRAQGPAGETGARLRRELAGRRLRLPLLGGDDPTASRNHLREFVLARDRRNRRQARARVRRTVPLHRPATLDRKSVV